MSRLLIWVNALAGLVLLVMVLSGVISDGLARVAAWNQFGSLEAKVVIGVAGVLAVGSAAYLAFWGERRFQHRS